MDAWIPVFAAFVTGGLLGLSGCVLQSVLRNPLAEPYILGLVGGGSLGVTAALHWGWAAAGVWMLPCASLGGSCLSLAIVCAVAALAARRAPGGSSAIQLRNSGNTVILAGFVTASFTCSLQMLILAQASSETTVRVTQWLFGDVRSVSLPACCGAAVTLAAVGAILWFAAHWLDVLELGADEAACLGLDTRFVKVLALTLVSIATAVAVALAGPIGFVGLVVPNLVTRCFGGRHRRRLFLSVLFGGLALVLADCAGRFIPGSVSAGVVCALVGSPLFLFLLVWRTR